MRALFSILLVIFSQVSHSFPQRGSTVIGMASAADKEQFSAYLNSQPHMHSLADSFFRQSPESSQSQALFETFKSAQKTFFSSSKAQALEAYLKVLEFWDKADWKPSQRKILFTSALRASELSESASVKQEFFAKAVAISLMEKPDSKVFPPPVVQRYNLEKGSHYQRIPVPESLRDAEILSVAGQVLRNPYGNSIDFPNKPTRVFAYSSKGKPVDAVMTAEQFRTWDPKISWYFSADCSNSQVEAMAQTGAAQVYVNKNCIINSRGKNILAPRKNIDLQVSSAVSTPTPLNRNRVVAPPTLKPWWKNKWLWIGVACAGAAYMIYENNRDSGNSGSAPTTVYE